MGDLWSSVVDVHWSPEHFECEGKWMSGPKRVVRVKGWILKCRVGGWVVMVLIEGSEQNYKAKIDSKSRNTHD